MEKINAFVDLYSLKEASSIWNVEESVLRRHILNGKFKENDDVRKFGKQWVITKQAMEREYGIIQTYKTDFNYSKSKTREIYRYISECIIRYSNRYKENTINTAKQFNKYHIYQFIYECYDYLQLGNTENVIKEIGSRIRRGITYETSTGER